MDPITPIQASTETTGRFIVTFSEGAQSQALTSLKKCAGITKSQLMNSADFRESGVDMAQIPATGGVLFEHLGLAVIAMESPAAGAVAQEAGENSAIVAVEPEGIMYALHEEKGLSLEYLRGFKDAAVGLYEKAEQGGAEGELAEIAAAFSDSASLTWGLEATRVSLSRFTGRGIRVAVLDTGLDLQHPDFAGRAITSRSFIPGVASAQDGQGHGTHCTGTALGPRTPAQGRRYGVASGAEVFIGKVLSDQGSGADMGILAGMDWAIANQCPLISMSLGADVTTTSTAYETAGQRALSAGTLIVAAAGNNARRSSGAFGFVGRPANSRSIMAVGALDSSLRVANFSARDTVRSAGTAVDIAGPGVAVYSSWPLPVRNNVISGTSMATPHVAGIGALWAEATGARGAMLYQRLISNARSLSRPVADIGRGLVQAP
ncbi:MAG: S8 family serine peptidase [Methylococcaceae bacterium]|nr:S8 family serine peptidase [Methylococcaceae bacterium]MCI0733289.1 S8 family serine peptidase [Methylococcaceae bacterium]